MATETTTPPAEYECEPIEQEFWAAFPLIVPEAQLEQIAMSCKTAMIDPLPELQQVGEQGVTAMDDSNLPQEHQESVQGELVGAASASSVVDSTSGLNSNQNLQQARQGPSIEQNSHPREETTTLQPLQLGQHQGRLQGTAVQPKVLTPARGGHQPQFGGVRNNINPDLPQRKNQPQPGAQHSMSGFSLQQAPRQKQNRNIHQQGHQGQSKGTRHQSTNAYNFAYREEPSQLEIMSPNIQCLRCGNPHCQYLAYHNLLDKPTYWCKNCHDITALSNLGEPLRYATPLSFLNSDARNMASDMYQNHSPVYTSPPGQVIVGPVRPQTAGWYGTVPQGEGKVSHNEFVQHLRQQSSNNDVQQQRLPKPFIPPNQLRGFGQAKPLQQQGYQNYEPQVANSFPQQPPHSTSFTPYCSEVDCNPGLISKGNPCSGRDTDSYGVRHLGQQYLQIQYPNNVTRCFTNLNEQQKKNQKSGQQPIARKGIEVPRKASKEPAHLIGVEKPCQWCYSTRTRFKFFWKVEQPTYRCGVCRRRFTFGGKLYHKKLAKDGLMLQYSLIPSPQNLEIKKGESFEDNSGDDGSDDDEEEVLGIGGSGRGAIERRFEG